MAQPNEAEGATAPASLAAVPAPAPRYYSPAQVAVGAFAGSPLVGGYLLSRNHRLLGASGARGPLLAGLLALLFLAGLGFLVPQRIGRTLADLIVAALFGLYARHRYAATISRLREQGAVPHSWWRVAGVVLALVALLVAMLAPLGWVLLH